MPDFRILSDPHSCATCRHFLKDRMACRNPVVLADTAKALNLRADLSAAGTLEMRGDRGACGPEGRYWMPTIGGALCVSRHS